MPVGHTKPGIGSVDQYRSGVPYIATIAATTTKTINLYYVANEVTLIAEGAKATCVLNYGSNTSPAITIPKDSSVTIRGKITKLTFTAPTSCTGTVIASLTGVEAMQCPEYDQDDYGSTD